MAVTSSEEAVEGRARSYFEALARRDATAMGEHWSEEGVADIVPLGVLRGPDEIAGFFGGLFAAIPDVETKVSRVVAREGEAAVEWRMSGRFTGAAFEGVDPTGGRIELRGMDLLEFEDGRIRANTAYYDGMSFARQIGMLPPRGSGAERALKSAFNAATRVRRAMAERRSGR